MTKFATLADEVRAALIRPESRLAVYFPVEKGSQLERIAKRDIDEMMGHMQRAHRMVLSEDFTRVAAKLSLLPPDLLYKAMEVARPPFHTTWFEWPEQARLQILRDEDGQAISEGAAETAGALVFRQGHESPDGFPYTITPLWSSGGVIAGGVTGIAFDFSQPIRDSPALTISHAKHKPREGETREEFVRRSVADSGSYGLGVNYTMRWSEDGADRKVGMLNELIQHFAVCFSLPMGRFFEPGAIAAIGEKRPDVAEVLRRITATNVRETVGDGRFILAVLTLLSIKDRVTFSDPVRPKHKAWVGGKFMPSYEYRTLSIKAPVIDEFRTVRRMMASMQGPRRWHTVRGAWHHSKKQGNPNCDHVYERDRDEDGNPVGSDRHVCMICGHKKWWVPAHGRGDMKIGVIDKGYEVVTREEKPSKTASLRPISEDELQQIETA